jgi:hypothetical protein
MSPHTSPCGAKAIEKDEKISSAAIDGKEENTQRLGDSAGDPDWPIATPSEPNERSDALQSD